MLNKLIKTIYIYKNNFSCIPSETDRLQCQRYREPDEAEVCARSRGRLWLVFVPPGYVLLAILLFRFRVLVILAFGVRLVRGKCAGPSGVASAAGPIWVYEP